MPDSPREQATGQEAGVPQRPIPPGRERLLRDLMRPGKGQALMGAVLFLVGLLLVTQVRTQSADDTYASMRRSDLIQLLDQLNAEEQRLRQESQRLERTKEQLVSGEDARRVAAEETRKRNDAMDILAGTVAAKGPGVRITIVDPQRKVTPEILLDAVEELRDAGAEAIELNDQVRIVGQTWFAGRGESVTVDGIPVQPPFTLEVIGEPHALEEGARFRGGLVSQVQTEQVGGQVAISRSETIQVGSLHEQAAPQWARPA